MTASICLALLLLPQLVDRTAEIKQPTSETRRQLSTEETADVLMARKMYRQAIDKYREALGDPGHDARVHNKIGIAYHHLIQFDQAQRSYERAYRLDPDYDEAINNLGTIYYAQNKYRKATKYYRKALDLNPNAASVYSNLGTVYFARKRYDRAMEQYLRALEIDPNVFEHRSTVGTLLQDRSVQDRAEYYYFMAQTYATMQDFDRALLYLRRAVEEGFRKRGRIAEEPAFAALHDNPQFQAIAAGSPLPGAPLPAGVTASGFASTSPQ